MALVPYVDPKDPKESAKQSEFYESIELKGVR